jgi:hypothetical protein
MDVVREVDDTPAPVSRWWTQCGRLNGIDDQLSRKILALHRDCGSGQGVCDADLEDVKPMAQRADWGCETTQLIADHFGVDYPAGH